MPLYEYLCIPNGHRFETRHGYNEPPVAACPDCGGDVRRVIQPVGIVFKGAGFYATDSRSSNRTAKSADSASSTDSDNTKSEGTKETAGKDTGGESKTSSESKSTSSESSSKTETPAAS